MKDNKKVSLGFSVGHDKGAVLIIGGEVVVGISEERLSRLKHDKGFDLSIPISSINYCLDYANLTYNDVDLYVYNTAELDPTAEQQIRFQFEVYLGQSLEKLAFIPHHLAHAYSAFFSSGYDEAAVIVSDAMGNVLNPNNSAYEWFIKDHPDKPNDPIEFGREWAEGHSIYHFDLKGWKEVDKKWVKHPFGWLDPNECLTIGTMYGTGTHQLIYKYREDDPLNNWPAAGAGKLMGLASYANKEWVSKQPFISEIKEDLDFFIPGTRVYPEITVDSNFVDRANVAGIYQREQERLTMVLAEKAKKLTGSKNICATGGSFLNCNSNELIVKSELFEGCYFTPPADDSGIPLGCAWWGYQQLDEIVENKFLSPYLGKPYDSNEANQALQRMCLDNPNFLNEIVFYRIEDESEMISMVSDLLNQNKAVGMHRGGSEIGPRALGNRSILASPVNGWMREYINLNIKGREWYRPFAPSVLDEWVGEIFDLDVFSPYMLITTTVKEEWRTKIPAVVHVDNTSRIQSVREDLNPFYHKLISKFMENSGVPVLLNTSFNGPDEPVVETPLDAIKTFYKRNLDALCVGNLLIVRK
jgi:carbamoyltransferase